MRDARTECLQKDLVTRSITPAAMNCLSHRTPVPGSLFAQGSINSDADEESRLSEQHEEPPAAEHLDD